MHSIKEGDVNKAGVGAMHFAQRNRWGAIIRTTTEETI